MINMAASRPSRSSRSEIIQVESSRTIVVVDEVDRVDRQNSEVDRCIRLDQLWGLSTATRLCPFTPLCTFSYLMVRNGIVAHDVRSIIIVCKQ